jgi:hypothetical protein
VNVSATANSSVAAAESKLSISDVTSQISKGTVISFLKKTGLKIGSGIMAVWGLGLHGQILVIVLTAIIVGVLVYEIVKHWSKLKQCAIDQIRRFGKDN